MASSTGNIAGVELLLSDKDIDIEARDDKGLTALLLACMGGHVDIVEVNSTYIIALSFTKSFLCKCQLQPLSR